MGRPLRILFVSPTVAQYVGGTETIVAELARRLAGQSELTVLAGVSGKGGAGALQPGGHRIATVPFAGRDSAWNRFLCRVLRLNPFKIESRSFFRSLARADIDLAAYDVVVTFYEMDAWLLARRHPALRERAVHLLPGVSSRRLLRRIDPRSVRFFGFRAGPRAERKWGVRIPALPLGVDEAFFPRGTVAYPASRRLVYVGRLDASKNVRWLADLYARSDLGARGYRLDVVGDGPLAATLQADFGATPGVRLLGRRSRAEVVDLLRGAHLVLHPSDLESFGLTLLEAMAAGVPVIGHDLPSVRAWARDHPVYAARLDRSSWLAAIARFEDPAYWSRVSACNLEFARSFGWDRVATQVLEILRERAGGPAPGQGASVSTTSCSPG
jgi:glycosyltransferase involved in cell wall biosynthesis